MKIRIGKTSKRVNSTTRSFNYVTIDAYFKEPTSIVNPTLIITRDIVMDGDVMRDYNYLYIPDTKRYYYINNVTLLDNVRAYVTCTVDTLATYRDDIINSNFVFDRTPYKNNHVLEAITPKSKYETVEINRTQYRPADENNVGIYIDIAGQADPSCNPTTTTYYMSIGVLKNLMEKVYKPETYASGTGIMDLMAQTVCNPSQYIVGCRISRLNIHESAPVSTIKFGWLDIPIEGAYKVPQGMYVVSWDRTITFPSWQNESNKRYSLFIPGHGITNLTPSDAYGTITVRTSVDMSNGSSYCIVYNGEGKIIYTTSGMMMVPVPISGVVAKMPTSLSGMTEGLVKAAVSAVGAVAPAVTKATNIGLLSELPPDLQAQGLAEMNSTPTIETPFSKDSIINSILEYSVKTTGGSGTLSELFTQKQIIATTCTNNFITDAHPTGYDNYTYTRVSNKGYYRVSYSELVTSAYGGEKNDLLSKLYSGFIYE